MTLERKASDNFIRINGSRYDFQIIIELGKQNCCISIKAIDKKRKLYSSINNLNAILALLKIDTNAIEYIDSSWNLSNKEIMKHSRRIIDALKDRNYICYLENKLDEDRACGEWENKFE